jgi:hypothetical protein
MKFSLAALLFVPLALAALPEQDELSENAVPAGLVTPDAPKADGLSAAAYCPDVNYPYLCSVNNNLCCPYGVCCTLECCVPNARYCYAGRCYL